MSFFSKCVLGGCVCAFFAVRCLSLPSESVVIPPSQSVVSRNNRSLESVLGEVPVVSVSVVSVDSFVASPIERFVDLYYSGSVRDFAAFLRDNGELLKKSKGRDDLSKFGESSVRDFVSSNDLSFRTLYEVLRSDLVVDMEKVALVGYLLDGAGLTTYDVDLGCWVDESGVVVNPFYYVESSGLCDYRRYCAFRNLFPEEMSDSVFGVFVGLSERQLSHFLAFESGRDLSKPYDGLKIVREYVHYLRGFKNYSGQVELDLLSGLPEVSLFDVSVKRLAVDSFIRFVGRQGLEVFGLAELKSSVDERYSVLGGR